jgi:hypothetical protein
VANEIDEQGKWIVVIMKQLCAICLPNETPPRIRSSFTTTCSILLRKALSSTCLKTSTPGNSGIFCGLVAVRRNFDLQ